MEIIKNQIKGKKGVTVCYTIPNFRFDETESKLKFDEFKFYTPAGEQDDGVKYFDVAGDEVLLERDTELDKKIFIVCTKDEGVIAYEILEGEDLDLIYGLEGDIVCIVFIPADPMEKIKIEYKEVYDESG
jgi:hypothetical protein